MTLKEQVYCELKMSVENKNLPFVARESRVLDVAGDHYESQNNLR